MSVTEGEASAIATRIVRALCGEAWISPPVRMVDEYPVTVSKRLILRGRPVEEIHSVKTVTGRAVDHVLRSGGILILRGAVGPSERVEVDYTYGVSSPPVLASQAIDALAREIVLAGSEDPSCRIPERVTNVTRQGVSWTLLDPQEFLAEGRTGIYEVDLAIRALNPGRARARARLYSAELPPPMRRRAVP